MARMMAVLVAVMATAWLGACADEDELDYRHHNQLTVEKRPVTLLVSRSEDNSRLETFVQSWFSRGEGPIEISVVDTLGGREAALKFSRRLDQLGLRADQVAVKLTPPVVALTPRAIAAAEGEVALLSYDRYTVQVPECGNWGEESMFSTSNRPAINFGCTTERNIGLMVQNPRDLVRARDVPPQGDANRVVDMITKYRTGKDSAWDTKVHATVSTVGSK